MPEKVKLIPDRVEVSKNKKEAYQQLSDSMKGRTESDIGLNDEYWGIRAGIHHNEAHGLWEPEVLQSTETEVDLLKSFKDLKNKTVN